MWARLILPVLLALSAAPAWADFQAGFDAYEKGDYATALKELHPLAEDGNAQAQLILGNIYATGQGLGHMYAIGQGVTQDFGEATRWYRRAAEQGMPEAQHLLALMYVLGKGVPQDYVQAHLWFTLAAGQGVFGSAEQRDQLVAKMTPAQLVEAQRLAREWKPKK